MLEKEKIESDVITKKRINESYGNIISFINEICEHVDKDRLIYISASMWIIMRTYYQEIENKELPCPFITETGNEVYPHLSVDLHVTDIDLYAKTGEKPRVH